MDGVRLEPNDMSTFPAADCYCIAKRVVASKQRFLTSPSRGVGSSRTIISTWGALSCCSWVISGEGFNQARNPDKRAVSSLGEDWIQLRDGALDTLSELTNKSTRKFVAQSTERKCAHRSPRNVEGLHIKKKPPSS